jgi:hypothetical protein
MANGSGARIFYQEVIDAIAQNPPNVDDLVVLRDLCRAVDAGDKPAVSRLAPDSHDSPASRTRFTPSRTSCSTPCWLECFCRAGLRNSISCCIGI